MIIVEDGTGIPSANSYQSLGGATSYHALRLNEAWSDALPAQQAGALVRATDYLELTYAAIGAPLTDDQALQWPVEGSSGLPSAVVAATTLLALYALSGALVAPATARGTTEVMKKLDGVGSTLTKYDAQDAADPYPMISSMLIDVARLRSAGGSIVGKLTR